MVTFLRQSPFWIAVGVAAVAEGVVIYQQWPDPPLKVCASAELGNLMAAAARSEAQARESRARLRSDPSEAGAKAVMRLEAESSAAMIEVANFKQRAHQQQKASGGSCG